LKDRLSTRNILRRKIMHLDSYNCVLCNLSEEETVDHLFMYCPFARDRWDLLNIHTSQCFNLFQASWMLLKISLTQLSS
jgi:5-methylcytosine-specific restriction endonuclease McrA